MAKKIEYPGVRTRNGKSTYRYDIEDPATGERIQKETPSFRTPKAAFDAGIQIQAQILNGTYVAEKKNTIKELIEDWIKFYANTGVKENTVRNRKSTLSRLKNDYGGTKAKEFTPKQYQDLMINMKQQLDLKKNTLTSFHAAASMLFEWAVAQKIIKDDPTKAATVPKYTKTVEELERGEELPEYLEKDEFVKFMKFVGQKKDWRSQQLWRIYYILAYSGLRVGEACALTDRDIDEINLQVSVTKTQLYRAGGIENFGLNTPKNTPSIRKVDVSKRVIDVLKQQITARAEYKLSKGDKYTNPKSFVFINCDMFPGRPLHIHTVARLMKIDLEGAKMSTSLTPHSLRHTYVSLMAEAGAELPALKDLIGHGPASKVTERIYLHVTKQRKRVAVEMLDDLTGQLI